MDKLYKSLIVVGSTSYVLWFFQPYNTIEIYDAEVFKALAWGGHGAIDILWSPIFYITLILYLFSAVGMWFYINWARNLFVMLTVTYIVMTPIGGISVGTSIDATLIYLTNLSDGALLFMCYFSSVAEKYKTHNKSLKERDALKRAT